MGSCCCCIAASVRSGQTFCKHLRVSDLAHVCQQHLGAGGTWCLPNAALPNALEVSSSSRCKFLLAIFRDCFLIVLKALVRDSVVHGDGGALGAHGEQCVCQVAQAVAHARVVTVPPGRGDRDAVAASRQPAAPRTRSRRRRRRRPETITLATVSLKC